MDAMSDDGQSRGETWREASGGASGHAMPTARAMTFEQMLEERGYVVYTNVGTSMMPLLRQRRDIIEIRPKEQGRCERYDVILYKVGEHYVLHRVLEVRDGYYVVAGDNNAFLEHVTDEQVLGVMTRVIRDGKDVTMDSPRYRAYVHLWCDAIPVRFALLRLRGRLGRVKRAILGR